MLITRAFGSITLFIFQLKGDYSIAPIRAHGHMSSSSNYEVLTASMMQADESLAARLRQAADI